jgi:transposase, IS5 family
VTDKFTTKGLADYFIDQRKVSNQFLDKIDALIDWKNVEKVLHKKYRKTASADGRPAYPALPMFKLLLLHVVVGHCFQVIACPASVAGPDPC